MENTSSEHALKERDIYYFRQRMKNRVFGNIVAFFADEAERLHLSKKDVARKLKRDPAQISRWLSSPTNLTLETISDLLLALGAESEFSIVRFSERTKPNYAHPVIMKVESRNPASAPPKILVSTNSETVRAKTIKTTMSSAAQYGESFDIVQASDGDIWGDRSMGKIPVVKVPA